MRGKVVGGMPRPGGLAKHDAMAIATRTPPRERRDPAGTAAFDSGLSAMRQEAGGRYAAAVVELLESYAELAAIEGVMSEGGDMTLRTFAAHHALADGMAPLRHREFFPRLPKNLRALIGERRASLTAGG